MLHKRPTTSQINRKYHNVAEEGRGTLRYYHQKNKQSGRHMLYCIVAFIAIILILILIFALIDGNSYFGQCKLIFRTVFHESPGKVQNNEVKSILPLMLK